MGYVRTGVPAVEPLSLAEARAQCKIDAGDATDDTLLNDYISAARGHVERITRRSLITQTWTATFEGFPRGRCPFRLPYGPVQAITSVNYYDDQNVSTLLASSLYQIDKTPQIARLHPAVDEDWPNWQARPDAVTIVYTAGYGAAGSDVPAPFRQAMKMLISYWYDHRDAVSAGAMVEVPLGVKALLGPDIVRSMA